MTILQIAPFPKHLKYFQTQRISRNLVGFCIVINTWITGNKNRTYTYT